MYVCVCTDTQMHMPFTIFSGLYGPKIKHESALLNEDHQCLQSFIKIPMEKYLKFCLANVYMRLLFWKTVKYPKELRLKY